MKRGGARPGAGRKKGGKNRETIEREAVKRAFDRRVLRLANRLLSAQLVKAEGCNFLMCRPKNGKAYVVKDELTIRRFLDGELNAPDGADFYYITTTPPDADAANKLLDRTFGRATEHHEVTGKDGEALVPTVVHHVTT